MIKHSYDIRIGGVYSRYQIGNWSLQLWIKCPIKNMYSRKYDKWFEKYIKDVK